MTSKELTKRYGEDYLLLPKEGQQALLKGGEWEYTPDSVEGEDAWAYYCDDCETYHQNWHVRGWRVEGGKLYKTIHDVDTDGNWDYATEAEVGTEEHQQQQEEYGFAAWSRQWQDYYEYVIETGKDPLDNFFVKRTFKRKQSWQFEIRDTRNGVYLAWVRRVGTAVKYRANHSLVPPDLLSYLDVAKGVPILRDFKKVADVVQVGTEVKWRYNKGKHAHEARGIVSIDVNVPNPQYERQLKAAARKALRESRQRLKTMSKEIKSWKCAHCGASVTTVEKPRICPGCDAGDPTNVIPAKWKEVRSK